MRKKLRELIEKRNRAIEAAQALVDKAESEDRGLSAEEREQSDRALADAEELRGRIEDIRAAIEAGETIEEPGDDGPGREPSEQRSRRQGGADSGADDAGDPLGNASELASFEARRQRHYGGDEYRSAFYKQLAGATDQLTAGERRAMSVAAAASGGALVAPLELQNEVARLLGELVTVRMDARVFSTASAEAIGIPRTTSKAVAGWVDETAAATETSFGTDRVEKAPARLARYVDLSERLLLTSGPDINGLVSEELADAFATAENDGFWNGDGTGTPEAPVGLFETTHADKVPTTNDLTLAATNAFAANEFTTALAKMDPRFFRGAAWYFHNAVVFNSIATLRDNDGRRLFAPAENDAPFDRINGIPVKFDQALPTALVADTYVGALCNMQRTYAIVEHPIMQIRVLREIKATEGMVRVLATRWVSGVPRAHDALVRIKTAAA